MSNTRSPLGGKSFDGYVSVAEAPLQGMITLRGDLASTTLVEAVRAVTGAQMPSVRAITSGDKGDVAWMSPDEVLLLVPHDKADDVVAQLETALSGTHVMAVNVSDARALFTVTGTDAREVIAKLAPVDMAPGRFEPGEMRRTRFAQVAAAFWMDKDGAIHVICFRSVAQYVFDLLAQAAQPGGEVGVFA